MTRNLCLLIFLLRLPLAWGQSAMSDWSYVTFPTKTVSVNSGNPEEATDLLLQNIPEGKNHQERYAFIIGNEHYEKYKLGLQDVAYASRDARVFKAYALLCWGIPAANIFYLEDVTAGIMQAYTERLSLLLRTAPAGAEVYFYFAGHGLTRTNRNSFIPAPLDADPQNASPEYSFQAMLEKLSRDGEVRVYAFTDACFSGRDRGGASEIAARGVYYRPAPGFLPKGVIHFAAARNNEYAFAWDEQRHGLFTAVLFSVIRKGQADMNWEQVYSSVKKEVMEKAARLHFASQEPLLTGHLRTLEVFKKQIVRN